MEWQELLKKFKDFRHLFVPEFNLMPDSLRQRVLPGHYNGVSFFRHALIQHGLEITATKNRVNGTTPDGYPEKFTAKVVLIVDTEAVWLFCPQAASVMDSYCTPINVNPNTKSVGIPLLSPLPADWPVPQSSQELAERLGNIFKQQPASAFSQHYIVTFNPDVLWSSLQTAYFDILEGFQQLWERAEKKAKDSERNYWFMERRATRAEATLRVIISICEDSKQTVGPSKVLRDIRETASVGVYSDTNIRRIISKQFLDRDSDSNIRRVVPPPKPLAIDS